MTMAKTISLINMKGGVGKSTLTINLAWHFAAYEHWLKKVLVVDLDPQFNASQYLIGVERYAQMLRDENPTIWEIFEQHSTGKIKGFDPKDVLIAVARIRGGGGIDLIPSRLELSSSLKNPVQKEYLLQRYLKKVESEYDIILIDCPPTESVFTISAYLASDYILVPVRPEYLSTIGLPLLASSMRDFKEGYAKQNPILCGIVFNAVTYYSQEEIKSKNEVKELAKKNEWYVFSNEILYSRSYPKGAREGQPIFRTSYARSDRAVEFARFAQEFSYRIGL